MPIEETKHGRKTHQIVRVVRAVRGTVRFRLDCQPAFDFARRPHQIVLDGRGAVFTAGPMQCALISRFPLASGPQGVAVDAGTPLTVDFKYLATGSGPNSVAVNVGPTNLFSLTNDTSHTAWTAINSTAPATAANRDDVSRRGT